MAVQYDYQKMEMTVPLADRAAVLFVHLLLHGNILKNFQEYSVLSALISVYGVVIVILYLIRKYEPKPIRIFLQDGSNDLNIYAGDWWKANEINGKGIDIFRI